MALFYLFQKKNCDICGGEIGLLGSRKLEDGNCCKNCAENLSRWFDDRRHSTVAQIAEQLTYREENAAALAELQPTKVVGENNLVYFDEKTRRFFVARREDYFSENPDILSYDQVLSCELKIDEDRTEITREITDRDGNTKTVSYNPKRYLFRYDFDMIIRVRHPYFDDMRFRLNNYTVELESGDFHPGRGAHRGGRFPAGGRHGFAPGTIDPTRDITYRSYVSMGEEIIRLLTEEPEDIVEPVEIAEVETPISPAEPESAAPVTAFKFCPNCGAENMGGKFCHNCGNKF